ASLRRLASPDEPAFRHAVETAEAFAEGRATNADAVAASRAAFASLSQQGDQPGEDHAAIRTALEYPVRNIPWHAAHADTWGGSPAAARSRRAPGRVGRPVRAAPLPVRQPLSARRLAAGLARAQ